MTKKDFIVWWYLLDIDWKMIGIVCLWVAPYVLSIIPFALHQIGYFNTKQMDGWLIYIVWMWGMTVFGLSQSKIYK